MCGILRSALTKKLGGFLVLVAVLAAVAWWRGGPRRVAMESWGVEDLVFHLHERGVKVRSVSSMRAGPLDQGVFLTTTNDQGVFLTNTNESWERLNRLSATPDRIDDWEGTVYCYRPGRNRWGDERLLMWGDCGQREGPFIFFGDRALRARISDALRSPPVELRPAAPGTLTPLPTATANAE
jgi:hypothetical protein